MQRGTVGKPGVAAVLADRGGVECLHGRGACPPQPGGEQRRRVEPVGAAGQEAVVAAAEAGEPERARDREEVAEVAFMRGARIAPAPQCSLGVERRHLLERVGE